MKNSSFYITTTLPYVNADLHMGHALEFVRADAIARFKKLSGFEVFFNTGTDEHGMKIHEKALSLGKTPLEFVNENFLRFKDSVKIFGMDSDLHFIRTTDEHHIKAAQEFWIRCEKNSCIYKKNYQTRYCVGCESEKSDSELNEKGECPDHPGTPLLLIEEENYFFKYSAFGDMLLSFYQQNPNFIVPDFRFNEIKAFVERGLQDFSISRLKSKMPWGIPVPGDEDQVMYVWFDALTNYISTLGWPNDGESSDFEKYWVNGNPTQYCGKDNTRFQGAMWQAMLMAAQIPSSHQIVVNGFITAGEGVKMSKTLGNVVDPKVIVEEYGTDALRYFLLREVSSFEDSPFTMERFKESYNANLANGLGNLVSRIMKMAVTYEVDYELFDEEGMLVKFLGLYGKDLEAFNIKNVTDNIWENIGILDRKIAEEKPFMYWKVEPDRARATVATLVIFLDEIAFSLKPFLPETSDKIRMLIREKKMPEEPLFIRKE
ncbi:MAG: methionine--tRNA ligase [bacterium]|nr:methionine--tRNA ligase [bacterium]